MGFQVEISHYNNGFSDNILSFVNNAFVLKMVGARDGTQSAITKVTDDCNVRLDQEKIKS